MMANVINFFNSNRYIHLFVLFQVKGSNGNEYFSVTERRKVKKGSEGDELDSFSVEVATSLAERGLQPTLLSLKWF